MFGVKSYGEKWDRMRLAFERYVIFMDLAMASATGRIGICDGFLMVF